MAVRLSKSKLIAFRECPKKLWLEIHRPELKVEDDGIQRRFATGYQVGELAQREYPDGYLIAPDNDLARAKEETKAEIASGRQRVLFEATFEAKGILARVDLLIPRSDGWHMVEVKSSASVKDYQLEDAAIQSWIAREAGLDLATTSLQVIDTSWTYPGGGRYEGIFKREAVDDRLQPILSEVPRWLDAAMGVAEGSEPSVKMGAHCTSPFECAFQEYCGSSLTPVEMPISWIPRLSRSKSTLFDAQGTLDIREADLSVLSDRQRDVAQAYINGEVVRTPLPDDVVKRFAGTRYYIDFETVMFGIPIWEGTRPYQQIPFQWSCHIEEPGQPLRHLWYLDLSGNDPSRRFAELLIEAVGKDGPVIVYNQTFEASRLKELAIRFPDLAVPLEDIVARMVDLYPITQAYYFHPGLEGSWSIKNVLKTIRPDLAYDLLEEVADGGAAPEAYLEAIDPSTSAVRKEQIHQALLTYCARDTEAMIHLPPSVREP